MESTKNQWTMDECLSTKKTLSTFYRYPFQIHPSKLIQKTSTRFELFSNFFTPQILTSITEESKKYFISRYVSNSKKKSSRGSIFSEYERSKTLSEIDILNFIAIKIISGCS